MDHVAGAQIAARGDRRAADGNAADGVAFLLNRIAALAADRSGHAAAELQIIIRGIDDGVDIHLRQIALHEDDFFADAHGGDSLSDVQTWPINSRTWNAIHFSGAKALVLSDILRRG